MLLDVKNSIRRGDLYMSKKVFVSAGHGGRDSGAVGNGFKEKDLNLSIALACGEYLKSHGVEVRMSRIVDEDDGTNQEVKESNEFGPDLTVSIHNNAGGGDGVEVFHSINGGLGKTCAENIVEEIVKIGQNSRGVKTRKGSGGRDYYGFIRMTNAPAVLVECAFVDNANDIQIIDTESKRVKMGEAIAKGILKTLGIEDSKPIEMPVDPPVVKKSVEEIAKEVLDGKYGNGDDRKKALAEAGYDYNEVQAMVNELLRSTKTESFSSYKVKVTAAALNIRTGPGTKYNVVGVIQDRGVYTIVDEKSGWGKLKSGAGWISLSYTKKV